MKFDDWFREQFKAFPNSRKEDFLRQEAASLRYQLGIVEREIEILKVAELEYRAARLAYNASKDLE